MRVLITGGAGCIGSDLARALVQHGNQVLVYDNLSSGCLEHLEGLTACPDFRFIEADLLDFAALELHMRGIDAVWHLAANPDVKFTPGEATDKDLQQNTIATYNVLECMRRNGVATLAFASTSAVYGMTSRLPIPEDDPCRPVSLYGASKLACEGLISAFQHLFGWRCSIFRFANIVGGKTRKRGATVISDFVRKLLADPRRLEILGDGNQAKSYLLSRECVDAMLFVAAHAPEPLAVYNIGCNDSLSVNRIAQMVEEAMGLRHVRHEYTGTEGGWPGDVPRFILDPAKINRLGWRARHNSEQAVAEAVRLVVERQGLVCRR
jgi:UDP-glucose 4-epimerase